MIERLGQHVSRDSDGGGVAGPLQGVVPSDAFPSKPVQIVVGLGVGSSADIISRIAATSLAEQWGLPVSMPLIQAGKVKALAVTSPMAWRWSATRRRS